MSKHYILVDMNNVYEKIDHLNTCGKCLCLKEYDLLSKIILLLNQQINTEDHIEENINKIIDDLCLDDIFDYDQTFFEKLKSIIYYIFNDMKNILDLFNLYNQEYQRRIGKTNAIFRIKDNTKNTTIPRSYSSQFRTSRRTYI